MLSSAVGRRSAGDLEVVSLWSICENVEEVVEVVSLWSISENVEEVVEVVSLWSISENVEEVVFTEVPHS